MLFDCGKGALFEPWLLGVERLGGRQVLKKKSSILSVQKETFGTILPAAGPIRPSMPCWFSPATPSLDLRCPRRSQQVLALREGPLTGAASKLEAGSRGRQANWRFEAGLATFGTILPAAGPIRPSMPWWFSPATPSLDLRCPRRSQQVLALREGPLTGAASKLEAGSRGRQANWRFEAGLATFGTMGSRPRARSAPHCHGVLALRHRPWTRAVPYEKYLQNAGSNLEAGSAERQVQARFEASF